MKIRWFARFALSHPFSIFNFYSFYYSYSYRCEVILAFLFNNLPFLTVKFLFCLYVVFFTL